MRARLIPCLLLAAGACRSPLTLPSAPGEGSFSARLLVAKPGLEAPAPAAGAQVHLLRTNVRATSNDAGRFTLSPLPAADGAVLVQFDRRADGSFARQRLLSLREYEAGPGRDVQAGDILLRESATARGRALLRDRAQERTGHRAITVFVPEGPFTGYTGDDGSFLLAGLPEGAVSLAFFREGYAPATAGPVELRPGEVFTLGDVLLERGEAASPRVPVAGRVTCRPAVADLSRARVEAASPAGRSALAVAPGGAVSGDLAPGLYDVAFAYEGYGSVTVSNLFVPPAVGTQAPAPVQLPDVTLGLEQPPEPDPGPVAAAPTAASATAPWAAVSARHELDGSATVGPAGHPILYTWSQLAGDPVTLERNATQDAVRTGFTAPARPQRLTFELEAKDVLTGRAGLAVAHVDVAEPPRATLQAPAVAATGATVALDASASTAGRPLVFSWRQTRGEAVTLSANDSTEAARTTFTAPATAQALAFELTVRDPATALTASAAAEVRVEVAPAVRIDSASLGRTGATFVLDASGSSAPAGHLLSFSWRQVDGPQVVLDRNDGPAAATTSFGAPATPRRLVFEVTATDLETTLAASARTAIDFQDAPTAVVSSPRTGQAGARFELDAGTSAGPAGHPLSFSWRQTAGETVTLTENHAAAAVRTSFVAPMAPQTLSFALTVVDLNTQFATTAATTIDFQVAPLAQARAPARVRALSAVQLDASASIGPAGHALVYSWRQSRGSSVALSHNDSPDAVAPTFQAPARAQLLAFDLTVIDVETQLAASTSLLVEVQEPPEARVAPPGTARAGGTFRLDASASTSPLGAPLHFRWTQTAGDSVLLSDNDSALAATPTFPVPARQQVLAFELRATDLATGLDDETSVQVLVLPAPVAIISPPALVVRPGARFRLDGSQSADPLGAPLESWRWSLLPADTDATLDGASEPTALVTAGQTPFVVQLVVATARLSSDPASVAVELNPSAVTAPVLSVTPGLQTVNTGSTVTLRAAFSHPDPLETVSVTWTQTAGEPVAFVVSSPSPGVSQAVLRAPDTFTTLVFDAAGRGSSGGSVVRSATVEVEDRNPPRIVSSAPATQYGAGPAFYASVTFDKDIDTSTLLPENFNVTGTDGTPVAADIGYDPATYTARLSFAAPLPGGTRQVLHLVGIRDRTPLHNVVEPVHMAYSVAPPRWDTYTEPTGASSSARPRAWLLYTPERIVVAGERVHAGCAANTNGVLWSMAVRKPGALEMIEPTACRGMNVGAGDFGPRAVVAGGQAWAYSFNGPLYRLLGSTWVPSGASCCQIGTDGTAMMMLWESYGTWARVWNPASNAFGPDSELANIWATAHEKAIGGDGRVAFVVYGHSGSNGLLARDASGRWSSQGSFGGAGRSSTGMARVKVRRSLPVVLTTELVSGAWKVRAWQGAWSGSALTMRQVGGDANLGSVSQADHAVLGSTLYVALAEGGLLQVRHIALDAASPQWVDDPGPDGPYLNLDPGCQVDRPSLAAAPDGLWLAWAENCDGAAPAWRVHVRQLTSGPAAPAFPPVAGPPRLSTDPPRTVTLGAPVTLTARADNPDPSNALSFRWEQVAGTAVTLSTTQTAAATSATFTAPDAFTTLVFRVVAAGARGGSDEALATVEVQDRTPPRIVSSAPAGDGGAGPALSASLVFDEAIDPATLTASTFSVREDGGTESTDLAEVPGRRTWDPATRTATLAYDRPLVPGAAYRLRVAGVADATPWHNAVADTEIPFTAAAPTWNLYSESNPALSTVSNRPWILAAPSGPTIVADRLDTVACPTRAYGSLHSLDVAEPDRLVSAGSERCLAVDYRDGDFGMRGVVAGSQVFAYSYGKAIYVRSPAGWASAGGSGYQIASDGAGMYMLYASYGLWLRAWNPGTGSFDAAAELQNDWAWQAHQMTGGGDGRVFYVAGPVGASTGVMRRNENGTWTRLAQAGGGGTDARWPRVLAFDDVPVLVAGELVSGSWKVRAYLGTGGSPYGYRKLGGADANSTGSVSQSDGAVVGRTLYVAFNQGGQIVVRRVDLDAPAAQWITVPGPDGDALNARPGCVGDRPTLASTAGKLWIAWSENCDATAPKWQVHARSLR